MRRIICRAFIILVLVCALPGTHLAQNLDRRVSLSLKDVSLKEALNAIEGVSGFYFSYSPQQLNTAVKVSIKARNKPLREILDDLFRKQGISWQVVENQLILKAEKQKAEIPPSNQQKAPAVKRHVISGTLRDASTGEVLIGAYAYVKGTTMGTTTNAYGFYSLSLPEGVHPMVFSLLGYVPVNFNADLSKDVVHHVQLAAHRAEMASVEIKAESDAGDVKNMQSGLSRIDTRTMGQLPGIAGELDIVKSLQAVPGVKSYGDGSAMFSVRGGKNDQNMILVDEAPVYNPAHLFGFISVLAPEAIKEMNLYKGDAPAQFGGRLSSTVDIKTRDGNMKRFGMSGNIGPFISALSLEGPFRKDKHSWLLAGRYATVNWLLNPGTLSRDLKMNFFDLNNKMNFRLNANNRLYFTFYYGQDVLSRENASTGRIFGITWNNLLSTLRWNHIYNQKLFSNTTLYFSRYQYFLFLNKGAGDYWTSSISNLGVKTDFTWYLNPSHTLRMGFEVSPHRSDPGNTYLSDENLQLRVRQVSKYKSSEYALYASNEQVISDRLNLKYGLRLSLWQNYGPEEVYIFDGEHIVSDTLFPGKNEAYASFFRPEPRLILNYHPGRTNNIRVSYSHNVQYLQILNNTAGPFTSMESWVPSGPNIRPQSGDQLAAGYFHRLEKAGCSFSAEAYGRLYHNTVDFADHADLVYNPLLEGELRSGKSWSYGMELVFRKTSGKISGWLSYTWSRAVSKIPEINGGKSFVSNIDVPHEVIVNLTYDNHKRWLIALNWIYHSGLPVTTPVGFYYYNGVSVPVYGDKNNDRLPDYHRLDLSVMLRLSKPERRFQHSLSLNIFNLYSRKNPFAINFSKFGDGNGNFLIPSDTDGNYELVPTQTSVSGIIPSINYKFRF
jgi:hypothetical protein